MQLSTEQVLSKEQARLLARCYELILSWSTPEPINATAEQSSGQSPSERDSTADTLSDATVHDQASACSEESITTS